MQLLRRVFSSHGREYTMKPHHETSLAVVNGAVHTMDQAQPLAEAVLLRGDRIVAVGSTDEIRALAPANTVEVDAAGHTVLPGLNDAHLHFVWFGLSLQRLRLADTTTLAQVQLRVAAATRSGESRLMGAGPQLEPQRVACASHAHPAGPRRRLGGHASGAGLERWARNLVQFGGAAAGGH